MRMLSKAALSANCLIWTRIAGNSEFTILIATSPLSKSESLKLSAHQGLKILIKMAALEDSVFLAENCKKNNKLFLVKEFFYFGDYMLVK